MRQHSSYSSPMRKMKASCGSTLPGLTVAPRGDPPLTSKRVRPVAALAAAAVVDPLRSEDCREHAGGEKGADEGSNGGNDEHDDSLLLVDDARFNGRRRGR